MKLFQDIYKDKKVLVTGHTGFKGSWMSLWLTELGADVVGYSLAPVTEPNLFEVLGLDKQITHIIGDITDYKNLEKVFIDHKPDMVFHMAAQSLVRPSYRDPRRTYETNVMGTLNILEAVRDTGKTRVVVNVTSDKCYENRETGQSYAETDPMGGYDPYSSSKGCAELVTSAYRNSFFNPQDYEKIHNVALASARAGNVIGGGDWSEDRLIPDVFRAINKNEPVIIRCPNSVRPWQHVLEPLSGYLLLGARMWENGTSYSQGWNFGPNNNDTLTVKEIVDKIIRILGYGEYRVELDAALHEAKLLRLDINKAKNELGWKPVYEVNQALEKTVEWYKNYYQKTQDMREYTLNQIKDYSSTAISERSL